MTCKIWVVDPSKSYQQDIDRMIQTARNAVKKLDLFSEEENPYSTNVSLTLEDRLRAPIVRWFLAVHHALRRDSQFSIEIYTQQTNPFSIDDFKNWHSDINTTGYQLFLNENNALPTQLLITENETFDTTELTYSFEELLNSKLLIPTDSDLGLFEVNLDKLKQQYPNTNIQISIEAITITSEDTKHRRATNAPTNRAIISAIASIATS